MTGQGKHEVSGRAEDVARAPREHSADLDLVASVVDRLLEEPGALSTPAPVSAAAERPHLCHSSHRSRPVPVAGAATDGNVSPDCLQQCTTLAADPADPSQRHQEVPSPRGACVGALLQPLKIKPLQLQPVAIACGMAAPGMSPPDESAAVRQAGDPPAPSRLPHSMSAGRLAGGLDGSVAQRPSVGPGSRLGRPPRPRSYLHLAAAAEAATRSSPPHDPGGGGAGPGSPVAVSPPAAAPASAAAATSPTAAATAAHCGGGGAAGVGGVAATGPSGRGLGGGLGGGSGDLFNKLVKMIEAHLPAAQQHKLHELRRDISKLKARKDRNALHGPLDKFFALVHQWAPREQWAELQACASQAGIKLIVDASGNVHIRKCSVAGGGTSQRVGASGGGSLRKEMLKQQQRRAGGFGGVGGYDHPSTSSRGARGGCDHPSTSSRGGGHLSVGGLPSPDDRGGGGASAMRGLATAKDTVHQIGA